MVNRGGENRQFLEVKEAIKYQKIVFAHKVCPPKIKRAFSGGLSGSGIVFVSRHLPELSSIVQVNMNYKDIPLRKEEAEQVLLLNNKPVGKVVQIEDVGGGNYNIGVLFFSKCVELERYMEYSVIRFRIYTISAYFLKIFLVLFIVFATLSLNIMYIVHRETYHPDKRMYITPQEIGISYDDVNFEAEDGQMLNGWFIPAVGAKATILYCNGRTGNMCDQLARVKFLHSMGANLMLFDYRGYGKNAGIPNEKGLYRDADAAYDYLVSRKEIDKDMVIVLGESLGGAVAANLCLERKVKALILESPVVSIAIQKKNLYPFLPTQFLLFEKFDTLSKIKKIRIPKLIIHGIDDEEVPFKEALQLYYAAPAPKQFLPFDGAHNDDIFKISDNYKDQLNKFFLDNSISLQ